VCVWKVNVGELGTESRKYQILGSFLFYDAFF